MRARLRRFLLLVLMLTVPVQAFAYSGMQACLFSDQGAAEPMAMSSEAMSMAGCHTPTSACPKRVQVLRRLRALASALPIEFVGGTLVVTIAHSYIVTAIEVVH